MSVQIWRRNQYAYQLQIKIKLLEKVVKILLINEQTVPLKIFQEMLIKKQKESQPYEISDFTKKREWI
ncbi:unnamed protein product [Paramecium sonneborni]|uniref:Uncharacterized protein n=1 Tax=Paramecium sonneborni TaxID=65129 RepID=A0A8S1RUH6_9CILI|nr:unnamed protein product [Paramecium sonneborni]